MCILFQKKIFQTVLLLNNMRYSQRKYRDKSIEIVEEVVETKKKKIKKEKRKGFFAKIKDTIKNIFKR